MAAPSAPGSLRCETVSPPTWRITTPKRTTACNRAAPPLQPTRSEAPPGRTCGAFRRRCPYNEGVLDTGLTRLKTSRAACRLRHRMISRLLRRFRVENRCQLAVLAVVTDAVTCDTVSPCFPAIPHSSLPPFDLTPVTNSGMLLRNTPPQPIGCIGSTAPHSVPANWQRVRIVSPSNSAAVFALVAASRPSSHPSGTAAQEDQERLACVSVPLRAVEED